MTNKKGFTIIELLVTLAMASVVMAAIFLSYKAQVQGKIGQEVALDMQQASRAALEMMTSDLRMAGCDPTWNAGAGFVTINPTELRITMDIGGLVTGVNPTGNESDGRINVVGEDVRYALSNGNLIRERFLNGASVEGEQTLISNVDGLRFVYLDGSGAVTADPTRIRSVAISFVVRSGQTLRGMMRSYTDNTEYVDDFGNTVYQAPGDRFRRFQLTTTVYCRNMRSPSL